MAKNGRLNDDDLYLIGNGGHRLTLEAAARYLQMKAAAEADGVYWTNTDSYRTYDQQVQLKKEKPKLAAKPGTSEHGWGEALDLATPDMSAGVGKGSAQYKWLKANASKYGFYTLTSKNEPWHWEYRGGATAALTKTESERLAAVNPKRAIPALGTVKALPPADIPIVASEIDVARPAPKPMSSTARLAALRSEITQRNVARFVESDAALGVLKPQKKSSPEDFAMTPGQMYTGLAAGDTALFTDPRIGIMSTFAAGMPGVVVQDVPEAPAAPDVPLPRRRPEPPSTTAPVAGMLAPGNIDLDNRQVYRAPDGTIRTENSISIGTDAGEVLIPTIINGKQVSDDEAIEHFERTGENLGTFATPAAADIYAKGLHNRQAWHYGLADAIAARKGEAVPLPRPRPEPPAKATPEPAKPTEYAMLPSGKEIAVGTTRNAKGELVTISRGPDGKAVITKAEIPWYLKGENTVAAGAVRDALTEEAKKAIRGASDAVGGLAQPVGGAIDAAKQGAAGAVTSSIAKLNGLVQFVFNDLATAPGAQRPTPPASISGVRIAPVTRQPVKPGVIPQSLLESTRVGANRSVEIVTGKLTTSIAFDPSPSSAAQKLATTPYAGVAAAFDKNFTIPPSLAQKGANTSSTPTKTTTITKGAPPPSTPKSSFMVLDSPSTRAALDRFDAVTNTSKKAAPSASIIERSAPIKTETATSTVKTPTKAGITGTPAAPPEKKKPLPSAPPVNPTTTPSAKPTYKTVTTTNPAYSEWASKYGTDSRASAGTIKETQTKTVSAPPAAPAKTITTRVPVTAPAPSGSPSRSNATISGSSYTIQPGDTLSTIARRSGTTVAELQRINGIADANKIYAGDQLVTTTRTTSIPTSAPTRANTAAVAAVNAINTNPNVGGRGDRWDGVLDQFGMII